MERFLWVCLAGNAGTGTRYLIALRAGGTALRTACPHGTLFANLVGCFSIACAIQTTATVAWSPTLRRALHTASPVEFSAALPASIEMVEDEAHVERLRPILDRC